MTPFWTRGPYEEEQSLSDINISLLSSDLRDQEPPLTNGSETEEIDLYAEVHGSHDTVLDGAPDASTTRSLIGHWGGSYAYPEPDGGVGDGLVSFTVSDHQRDGSIIGAGYDALGTFTIHGEVKDNNITFMKEYQSLQGGHKTTWKYVGMVDDDLEEVHGIWGYPEAEWSFAPKMDARGVVVSSPDGR